MRTLRYRALVAAVTALLAVPCFADHAAKIDPLVQPLVDDNWLVGCVVGVIDGDQTEIHAYGETTRGDGQKPDGATLYEIGSVTKALTGTLLADMVERGEARLDQPIDELLPEGVTPQRHADDQPVTLLHLATHTSGLPRMPHNMAPKDPTNPYADYTPELMYDFLKSYKLHRAPGEYEYSNYGVGLLGTLLARCAGKSYEELVTERIADPLGMQDTRITLTPDQKARLAPPYNVSLKPDKNWDQDAIAPAGAVRSTALDMLKLLAAAMSDADEPVSRRLRRAAEQRHAEPGQPRVGLAWHIADDGVTRWHNGQTGGYSSYVAYYKPKQRAVVVLSNTATDLTTSLGEKILQTLLGMDVEPVKVRKEVAVDPAVLERYVGVYWLAPTFAITITLEDGQLMLQATGQSKNPIFPESETEFFLRAVDAQITFDVTDDGTVKQLTLHQNGAHIPGPRAPDAQKSQ